MQEVDKGQLIESIKQGGYIIVPMINMQDDRPPVVHSVGLTEKYGMPELVVAGLDIEFSVQIIHTVIQAVVDRGGVFASREAIPLPPHAPTDTSPMRVIDTLDSEVKAFPFIAAELYYGDRLGEIKFQQVLVPDMNGFMPWDEGFAEEGKPTQTMFWTEGGVHALFPEGEVVQSSGFFSVDEAPAKNLH